MHLYHEYITINIWSIIEFVTAPFQEQINQTLNSDILIEHIVDGMQEWAGIVIWRYKQD